MPLAKLVQEQIERSAPAVRAGVVLAVAVDEDESVRLREQRINLAAALEILYVALNVHKLLLKDHFAAADKSLLGGTILAGDFCFSQAANLAIKTENPLVVDLFSQALKVTSEGNLRHLFDDHSPPFSDNLALCRAGVEAGMALLDERSHASERLLAMVTILAESTTTGLQATINKPAFTDLNPAQQARMTLLATWLADPESPLSFSQHSR
jgi:octaprenyl-diphosphate synthase